MADPRFEIVPIGDVHPSPINVRRHVDEVHYTDLLASITARGVQTPLLVRPNKKGFEIYAGHTRYRAAREANLVTVPILIRDLTDQEFLELMIEDNLQRKDLHPLDEANSYEALQKADKTYTPAVIAGKVGKDVSYVYRRLKLLKLSPEAKKAFEKDWITVAHAERLAKLTGPQQAEALDECFEDDLFTEIEDRGDRMQPKPLHELERWIATHVKTEIASPDTPHYFPEFAEQLEQDGKNLLQLSDSHMPGMNLGTRKHGLIGKASWEEITSKKDECQFVRDGVIVHGGPMRIVRVCAQKGCPKHRPPAKRHPASTAAKKGESPEAQAKRVAKEKAAQRETELAEARRELVEERAIGAALSKVTAFTDDILRLLLERGFSGDVSLEAFNKQFGTKVTWANRDKAAAALKGKQLVHAVIFCNLQETVAWHGEGRLKSTLKNVFKVDVDKIDAEIAKEQAIEEAEKARGTCKYCGCTENTPCTGGCAWLTANQTVCDSPDCEKAYLAEQKQAAKKPAKKAAKKR